MLESQPIDTILNKNLVLEATSSKYWQGKLLEHQRKFFIFDYFDETFWLPHHIVILLFDTVQEDCCQTETEIALLQWFYGSCLRRCC